jgi:hypothetical protein
MPAQCSASAYAAFEHGTPRLEWWTRPNDYGFEGWSDSASILDHALDGTSSGVNYCWSIGR